MVAVEAMSAGAQAVFYFIAFAALVVASILSGTKRAIESCLLCAGLAVFVFVHFWNALSAA